MPSPSPSPAALDLRQFYPYQLAVLAETVSRALAQVYTARFDLTRDEWRVLAALAQNGSMRTSDVIAHTTLEKMQVSRAVARLHGSGHLERSVAAEDRRNQVVALTPSGQALMKKLAPMVRAREAFLLEALTEEERQAYASMHRKVLQRARQLLEQG